MSGDKINVLGEMSGREMSWGGGWEGWLGGGGK